MEPTQPRLTPAPLNTSWLTCTWLAGPDAGGVTALGPGRHVLGRAPSADLRNDDPALEPHHLLVEVTGTVDRPNVAITQLAGRVPVRAGGQPLHGPTNIALGEPVEVAHSLLALSLGGPPPSRHDAPLVVVRSARTPMPSPPAAPPALPPAPERGERPGGLAPAAFGVVGAGAMAAVLRQPMFLMFGVLGAMVALGSWGAQWMAVVRRHRRALAHHRSLEQAWSAARADGCRALAAHATAVAPGLTAALTTAANRSSSLWARRSSDPDAFTVALGTGNALFDELVVSDVSMHVSLGPRERVVMGGPLAMPVARSVIAQLVAQCGPADVRVVVLSQRPSRWEWLAGLPHCTRADGGDTRCDERALTEVIDELRGGNEHAHLVVVTDEPELMEARTSTLRRVLADGDAALLAVMDASPRHDDQLAEAPQWCTAQLLTGLAATGAWVADIASAPLPARVRLAGLGEQAATRFAGSLHGLIDPEDPAAAARSIPRTVTLANLVGDVGDPRATHDLTASAIAARWAAAGPDAAPRGVVGMAADGAVDIDLVRDGPHGLVAGTTGAGKSEFLRTLVTSLAVQCPPTQLSFVLVDYKGGATFDACAHLPHVVGVVTDLDDQLADRALRSLHAELRRREHLLREHSAADLAELRRMAPAVVLPRLVVVIDEFAALVAEQPAFLHALVGVAQRGRSLGVHLLLATQRPQGVISDDIRANTNLRVALRVNDVADALDVVGDRRPAALPRTAPGRAVMRLGPDDHVEFQSASCTMARPDHTTDLAVLVRAVTDAARLTGLNRPPAPWCPPLPTTLSATDDGSLGVLDDPDHQRVLPLYWTPDDGSLILAGSVGSGLTSAVLTLAHEASRHHQVFIVDAMAEQRFQHLDNHQGCAVVPVANRERLVRLLHLLQQPLSRPTLLVVHGIDQARHLLDEPDTVDLLDDLDSLVAGRRHPGRGAALTMIVTTRHPSAVPSRVVHACPHRWVLHLTDPHEASLLGVAPGAVPPRIAGRVYVAPLGLSGQLVTPPTTTAVADHVESAAASLLVETPTLVVASRLPVAIADDDLTHLPLGVAFASGAPAVLAVPDGEHVLVCGPARRGRSSTLVTLAHAWRTAHPHGVVVAVAPRRSPITSVALVVHDRRTVADAVAFAERSSAAAPCLLLIDDAELVDDPHGALHALATSAAPGVLIAAAGRPDALRALYGHWTAAVRRSRLGVVLTGGSDLDGDLLGVTLPRRLPVAARPGLAWMVGGDAPQLVQLAMAGSPATPLSPTADAHRHNASATALATASSVRS